jgi:ABC-type sugar transport system permease subunit
VKAKFWDKAYPYASILVPFLAIALFTIYPVLYAVRISFYRYVLTKPNSHPFIGLKNFTEVIESYYFRTALVNTAFFTAAVVIGVTLFGIVVALLLNSKAFTAPALRIIILLPWAIPAVVAGLIWKWILNSDFGILSGMLYKFGIIDQYIPFLADPRLAKMSMVAAWIWKEGPLAAIFFMAGLQLIPKELYEAARMDGGSDLRIFRHVTLPLLRPILLIVIIYETIRHPDLITFCRRARQCHFLISWFAYAGASLNLGHGVALAIVIALIILVLILIYLRVIRSEEIGD